jgi:hypothetical protein
LIGDSALTLTQGGHILLRDVRETVPSAININDELRAKALILNNPP